MRTLHLVALAGAACISNGSTLAGDAPSGGPAAGGPAAGKVPVETFFKGKIVKLEGRSIELAYDFATATQLEDFEPSIPFRAIKTIASSLMNGQLHLTGTGSFRHKAIFGETIAAAVTLTPVKNRDFGLAVTEERESEVFTLYCLYDRYFGAGDNVHVPQNMIIKFIPRDPKVNTDGRQDWRYCGSRGQKPEIERGVPYKVTMERAANESRFTVADWESKGKEASRDLTSQRFALYAYDGDFKADDLTLRGMLDPAYIERNKIDLASWKPPAPEGSPASGAPAGVGAVPEAAARLRARIAGYPLETKPSEMAALLRDPSLPADVRAEAVQKAVATGQKKIVPFLVDGLYAEDEASRRDSYEVLTKLCAKSFGYRADAAPEARKKAIPAINEYLKKHAPEFQ